MYYDNEFSRDVKRVNAYLARLYKQIGTNNPGWAASALLNKLSKGNLDLITDKGFVKYNKNLSDIEKKAIRKASKSFLDSKTKTVKGVKEAQENIKKKLEISIDISSKEASDLFDFFEKKDYDSELIYELYKIASYVKRNNDTLDTYIERAKEYIEIGNDANIINLLSEIWGNS